MATDIHLGALPMSFNFLSLVLVKAIEKSCCSEEVFLVFVVHKI